MQKVRRPLELFLNEGPLSSLSMGLGSLKALTLEVCVGLGLGVGFICGVLKKGNPTQAPQTFE